MRIPFFISNKCEDFSKATIRVKAIQLLMHDGSLTNRDLVRFTNGQTWLTSDLRRDGFILPKSSDTWEKGASGKRFKRYYWSGKRLGE
jgi:hypothetical protein